MKLAVVVLLFGLGALIEAGALPQKRQVPDEILIQKNPALTGARMTQSDVQAQLSENRNRVEAEAQEAQARAEESLRSAKERAENLQLEATNHVHNAQQRLRQAMDSINGRHNTPCMFCDQTQEGQEQPQGDDNQDFVSERTIFTPANAPLPAPRAPEFRPGQYVKQTTEYKPATSDSIGSSNFRQSGSSTTSTKVTVIDGEARARAVAAEQQRKNAELLEAQARYNAELARAQEKERENAYLAALKAAGETSAQIAAAHAQKTAEVMEEQARFNRELAEAQAKERAAAKLGAFEAQTQQNIDNEIEAAQRRAAEAVDRARQRAQEAQRAAQADIDAAQQRLAQLDEEYKNHYIAIDKEAVSPITGLGPGEARAQQLIMQARERAAAAQRDAEHRIEAAAQKIRNNMQQPQPEVKPFNYSPNRPVNQNVGTWTTTRTETHRYGSDAPQQYSYSSYNNGPSSGFNKREAIVAAPAVAAPVAPAAYAPAAAAAHNVNVVNEQARRNTEFLNNQARENINFANQQARQNTLAAAPAAAPAAVIHA